MLEPVHNDLPLKGSEVLVVPSTVGAEGPSLTITQFIALMDSCLIDCDSSEEQNLAPLKSYKKHLERLLEKKGDRAMDWLDCDYFVFEYGLPTEENYAMPLDIPIQFIFQGLEHIQKDVYPAPKWSQNFNALMDVIKRDKIFQVQRDRLDFELKYRNKIKSQHYSYFKAIDRFIYSFRGLENNDFYKISKIPLLLRKKNLLTPKITSFILSLSEKTLSELYGILKQLNKLNLLTGQNLAALLKSSTLVDSLEEGYCFQSSIFYAPRSIYAFRFMGIIRGRDYAGNYNSNQESFLDQAVFDQAIDYHDIFNSLSVGEFWYFLESKLNRPLFDEMVQLCKTYKEDIDTASLKIAELLNAYKLVKRLKQDHNLYVFQHKTWFDRALPASVVLSVQNQTPPVLIKVSPVFGRDAYYLYGLSKDGQAKLTSLSVERNPMISNFRPTHSLRYKLSHDLTSVRAGGTDWYVSFPKEAHVSLEYNNRVRRLNQYADVIYAVRERLDRVPNHLLRRTPDFFDTIFDLCEQHQGNIETASHAINEFINARLRQDQNNNRGNINYSQSIHADSVHKSVSRSMMRLAGTGFDLALSILPPEENCTLETLKANKYQIPCLIKQELTDVALFYLYGRNKEGNPTLTLLDETSEIWQEISSDHKNKTIWVSQNENEHIYQSIRQENAHFSGYPGVIADSSKVEQVIKELQEWGKQLGAKGAIDNMLVDWSQGLNVSTEARTKMRVELEFKQQKAKEAVETLTKPSYHYNDRGSGISIRQMLALVWIAIHDDRPEIGRKGSLKSAQRLLMDGFYEIQEGYNLDAQGNWQGRLREDAFICVGGSFNKMLEKLQGVHADVQIDFITRETFSLKLRAMVQEEAIKHLTDFPQGCATVKKAGNFSPISENIKPVIREQIEEEFGEKLPVKPEEVSDILEAIFSTNLPENFYQKYAQIFSESGVLQTEKEAAPQPSASDNSIINVKLGKYGVLMVDNTSEKTRDDILSRIKAHLKQENVISEETYNNTVVKVIFSGKIYKTDSSTLEADNQRFYEALKTACELTGTNTITVTVQIAVPKKQEEQIQPVCPKDLTQSLCYQALIDRINIVRKRLEENSNFQVQAKNQVKLAALLEIQKKFVDIEENPCSVQEIYDFLTSQPIKDAICQSTSKLPTFFQDPVDSKLLLQAFIDKLEPLVNPSLVHSQSGPT